MTTTDIVRSYIRVHDGPFTASQCAEWTKLPPEKVRAVLDRLMRRGEVSKHKGPKSRCPEGNHGWGRWCERCWSRK